MEEIVGVCARTRQHAKRTKLALRPILKTIDRSTPKPSPRKSVVNLYQDCQTTGQLTVDSRDPSWHQVDTPLRSAAEPQMIRRHLPARTYRGKFSEKRRPRPRAKSL